jgi:hypothetical protein
VETFAPLDFENVATLDNPKVQDESRKFASLKYYIVRNDIHEKEKWQNDDDDISVTEYKMTEILRNFDVSGRGGSVIKSSTEKPNLG